MVKEAGIDEIGWYAVAWVHEILDYSNIDSHLGCLIYFHVRSWSIFLVCSQYYDLEFKN